MIAVNWYNQGDRFKTFHEVRPLCEHKGLSPHSLSLRYTRSVVHTRIGSLNNPDVAHCNYFYGDSLGDHKIVRAMGKS